jgi:hypothetical protein
MARPRKDGLDYFPVDVNILSDIKTKKLIRGYGTETITILIYLLSAIYRDNGYYLQYDDDLNFIIADEFNFEENFVEKVILKMLEVDFFNKQMFEQHKILTSEGIQKRYLKASERRVSVNILPTYYLINDDSEGFMYTETPNEQDKCIQKSRSSVVSDNRSTQSKVKNSKEKESKEQESKNKINKNKINKNITSSSGQSDITKLIEIYQENFGVASSIVQLELEEMLELYGKEMIIESFKRSVGKDKPFSYMRGIWNKWKDNGITTLEQANQSKRQYKPYSKPSGYVEPLPDWAI